MLVQISTQRGVIKRQADSETTPPVVELHLEPNQRVIQIDCRVLSPARGRKTVDWIWTATIENRLGARVEVEYAVELVYPTIGGGVGARFERVFANSAETARAEAQARCVRGESIGDVFLKATTDV